MSGYFNVLLQDARLRDFSNVVQGCSCTTRPFNGYVDYFSWPSFSNVQCVPFASMRFPTPSLPVTMLPPGIGVNVNSVSNQALTGNDISKLMYIPQNALPSQSQIPSMQNILEAMVLKSFAEEMGKKMAAEQLTQIPQQTSNIFNQNNQPSGAAQMNQNDMMQLMVIFMSMLTEMANMLKAAGNVGQGNTPSDSGNRTDSPVRTDSSSGSTATDSTNDSPSVSPDTPKTQNDGKSEGTGSTASAQNKADKAKNDAEAAALTLAELEKEKEKLNENLKDKEGALTAANDALAEATTNNEKAQGEFDKAKEEATNADKAYNEKVDTRKALEGEIGNINSKIKTEEAKNPKDDKLIAQLNEQLKQKNSELEKAKEEEEKALQDKTLKEGILAEKEEALKKAKSELETADGVAKTAKSERDKADSALKDIDPKVEKARTDSEAANEKKFEADKALKDEKEVQSVKRDITAEGSSYTKAEYKEMINKLVDNGDWKNVRKLMQDDQIFDELRKNLTDREYRKLLHHIARGLLTERQEYLKKQNRYRVTDGVSHNSWYKLDDDPIRDHIAENNYMDGLNTPEAKTRKADFLTTHHFFDNDAVTRIRRAFSSSDNEIIGYTNLIKVFAGANFD